MIDTFLYCHLVKQLCSGLPHATFGLFMFSKTIVGKQNVANLEGPSNFQPAAVQSGNDDA